MSRVTENLQPSSPAGRPAAPLVLADLLKAELARRCRENPAYSLRAFAKSLGFSPAFVSKLLKGQRRFTEATINRVAQRLEIDPADFVRFRSAAQKKKPAGAAAESDGAAFRRIELDQFQLIADWYHFAILELTTVKGF
ncbi:MAG: helix-turn-helix domain-containing protein, partial [Bdellovibrionota bacterium]